LVDIFLGEIAGLGDDGDYLDIKIDIETGKIVGWRNPDTETIKRILEDEK
jgi:hypothetical protein